MNRKIVEELMDDAARRAFEREMNDQDRFHAERVAERRRRNGKGGEFMGPLGGEY